MSIIAKRLANKTVSAEPRRWQILMRRIFILVEMLSSPGALQSQLLSSIKPPNRDRYESVQAAISAQDFRYVGRGGYSQDTQEREQGTGPLISQTLVHL